MPFWWRLVSKPIFQVDLPASLKKELSRSISRDCKAVKTKSKKSQEKEMLYQPGRLSPLNYLVLKVLQGQFGENSHPAIPIAIGLARKGISQAKRILSHGSL